MEPRTQPNERRNADLQLRPRSFGNQGSMQHAREIGEIERHKFEKTGNISGKCGRQFEDLVRTMVLPGPMYSLVSHRSGRHVLMACRLESVTTFVRLMPAWFRAMRVLCFPKHTYRLAQTCIFLVQSRKKELGVLSLGLHPARCAALAS